MDERQIEQAAYDKMERGMSGLPPKEEHPGISGLGGLGAGQAQAAYPDPPIDSLELRRLLRRAFDMAKGGSAKTSQRWAGLGLMAAELLELDAEQQREKAKVASLQDVILQSLSERVARSGPLLADDMLAAIAAEATIYQTEVDDPGRAATWQALATAANEVRDMMAHDAQQYAAAVVKSGEGSQPQQLAE